MELTELQRHWDTFGERDALGAILTVPSKMNRGWELGEFFRTGVAEIEGALADLRALGIDPPRRTALDFGCGVGRLTQALCRHFDQCSGVDIAPSMIRLANRHNRFGRRCRYHLNAAPDLALFGDGSFDFIYSYVVLQHMRPEYARGYIREFLRVLAPGGVLVFQLPSTPCDLHTQAAPLPAGAFRAGVELLEHPVSLYAGARAGVRVRLTNAGNATWPHMWNARGTYHVQAGNRWLDPDGRVLVVDDGRAGLPGDIGPGGHADLRLTVTAPAVPGRYLLEVDAVQEGVAWFGKWGSRPARVAVRVTDPVHRKIVRACRAAARVGRTVAARGPTRPEPVMEMHGIEHHEVGDLIAHCGGTLADLRLWTTTDWTHARYCVTRGHRKGDGAGRKRGRSESKTA